MEASPAGEGTAGQGEQEAAHADLLLPVPMPVALGSVLGVPSLTLGRFNLILSNVQQSTQKY